MWLIIAVVAIGGLGAYGWWRGGMRFGLALGPLLIASILLWLFSPVMLQIGFFRNMGLMWPFFWPLIFGLGIGYGLQFALKKKLPEEPSRNDRIGGVALGGFVGIIATWLGTVLLTVLAAQKPGTDPGVAADIARGLNSGVVRWVPGVGAGSQATMALIEVATADDEVREVAIDILGIRDLADNATLQTLANDPDTHADLEAASSMNFAALYRLQKNPLVLALADDKEFTDAMARINPKTLLSAIEEARQTVEDRRNEPSDDDR